LQLGTVGSDEVHVWLVSLDRLEGTAAQLPPPDRARAERYLNPQAMERWVASRLALGQILAKYLHRPASTIEIAEEEGGKPRLPGRELEFNLSHSGDLALVAVSQRAVGVDVERIEPARDLLAIAERSFGEAEVARVRDAAPHERAATFYEEWTRHEARLKCLGVGLAGPEPAPGASVAVRNLEVPSGYAAAVAVAGEAIGALRCWTML